MIKIEDALHNFLETKQKSYPQHVNRISQLDDPCNRRLFYYRTAWDKATAKDDNFLGILETGNELESVIGRIISQIGEPASPQASLKARGSIRHWKKHGRYSRKRKNERDKIQRQTSR